MASITLLHAHSLGLKESLRRADELVKRFRERLRDASWNGSVLSFRGTGFSGSARVHAAQILFELDLSVVLWPMKARIEARIEQALKETFPNLEPLADKFQADICAGRFEEAFELAERLLEMTPSAETYETLIAPIDPYKMNFRPGQLYDLLRRLEEDKRQTHLPWRRQLRFVLLSRIGWPEEALVEMEESGPLPERYAWMRHERGRALMEVRFAYTEAAREFDATLKASPAFWKSAACMAECALCRGCEEEAFAIFDNCLEQLPEYGLPSDLRLASIWRAELSLWTGRYAEAERNLDEHARADTPLALGWRGAARLLQGNPDGALADLNRALTLTPSDPEAMVWRGETYAKLERWDEASADFDRAANMAGGGVWPLVDRALARLRAGDQGGFWSDYDRLPNRVRDFFAWKNGVNVERDVDKAASVLQAMLVAARGVRRSEVYLYPVWIRRDER